VTDPVRRIDSSGRVLSDLLLCPTIKQVLVSYVYTLEDGSEQCDTAWTQMPIERMNWMLSILRRDVEALL